MIRLLDKSRRHLLIVVPQLGDQQGIGGNLVHDAVFRIDPSGPVSGQKRQSCQALSAKTSWDKLR
jgi:hypothetical protein